jgi:hypothetical protein
MCKAIQDQQTDEVQGYDVTSGGLWPAGTPHPASPNYYNPAQPQNGGWDGAGPRHVPAVHFVPASSVSTKRHFPY